MIEIQRIEDPLTRGFAAGFVDLHHSYIDWADRPSRKLYWSIYEDERFVGVFGLGSAYTWATPVRAFVKRHALAFNEIGNNIVFCLAGHHDRNVGSRSLSLLRRDARAWWKQRYGDDLRAMQTFILPPRSGAVYKADNWTEIGSTLGESVKTTCVSPGTADDDLPKHAERRTFKNGQTRVLVRENVSVDVKTIFMRML